MEKQKLDDLTKKHTEFCSFDDLVRSNIIPTISSKLISWFDDAEHLLWDIMQI